MNVRLTTTINENGECWRSVTYTNTMTQAQRDSAWGQDVWGWSLPIPKCIDIDQYHDSHTEIDGDSLVTTTFRHVYDNVDEMCTNMPVLFHTKHLTSKGKLEKKFRFFYTEYSYLEEIAVEGIAKYPANEYRLADYKDSIIAPLLRNEFFPSFHEDDVEANELYHLLLQRLDDITVAEVLPYLWSGEPDLLQGIPALLKVDIIDGMMRFCNKWEEDNETALGFDYIVKHYDAMTNPPITREEFISKRDVLIASYIHGKNSASKFLQETFDSDAFEIFFDHGEISRGFYDAICNFRALYTFHLPYMLQMPGEIIDAGAGTITDGNTLRYIPGYTSSNGAHDDSTVLSYTINGDRLISAPYIVSATSRVTNTWAYVLTIIVIIAAAALTIINKRK